ncbi:family 16 glycoside hydrolase [Cohnella cellulosilytica]|uniref:Family 16 glycoside hydrolase n=1 Tax=Cohnella cellulosilytica TaxID=986710 RepID=A0ABW2F7S3_9BACL
MRLKRCLSAMLALVVLGSAAIATVDLNPVHAGQPVLAEDDFESGNDLNWLSNLGNWQVVEEPGRGYVYSQDKMNQSGYFTTITDKKFDNFEMELDYNIVNRAGDSYWAGVMFRKSNELDNYNESGYLVTVQYNGWIKLYKADGHGAIQEIAVGNANKGNQIGWCSLKVAAEGTNIRVYYNGETTPVLDIRDDSFTDGYAGLVTGRTFSKFDNVVISQKPTLLEENFEGLDDSGWSKDSGAWAVQTSAYGDHQFSQLATDDAAGGYTAALKDAQFGDFSLEFQIELGLTGQWAGVSFRKSAPAHSYSQSGYMVFLRPSGTISLYKAGAGEIASSSKGRQFGRKSLRIVADGPDIRVYYENELEPSIHVTDAAFGSGYVSLVTRENGASYAHLIFRNLAPVPVFTSDFDQGSDDGWMSTLGDWQVVEESGNKAYRQSRMDDRVYQATWRNGRFDNFNAEFDYEMTDRTDDAGWAGLQFRKEQAQDRSGDSGYLAVVQYDGWIKLFKADGAGDYQLLATSPSSKGPQTGRKKLRINDEGPNINVYYDQETVPSIQYTDDTYRLGGYVGLATRQIRASVDNFTISAADEAVYDTVDMVTSGLNIDVNSTVAYRIVAQSGGVPYDTSGRSYTLTYDKDKLCVDPDTQKIKGLQAGTHPIVLEQDGLTSTLVVHVNDYDEYIRVRGETLLAEDFEGQVGASFMPDSHFTIANEAGNHALQIDGNGAVRRTDVLGSVYLNTDHLIEADVKQLNGTAGTNGGFSIGARMGDDQKSYLFRYMDIIRYNPGSHKFNSQSDSLRDTIGIARNENTTQNDWYYGNVRLDGPLGILDTGSRSFLGKSYRMTAVVAPSIGQMSLEMSEAANGAAVGSVAAATGGSFQMESDLDLITVDRLNTGTSGAMTTLETGGAFLQAENTKVQFDNVRISRLHPARAIELKLEDAIVAPGQATRLEVRAVTGARSYTLIPLNNVAFRYDPSEVTLNTSLGTVVSSVPGEHTITVKAADAVTGKEKQYTVILTVLGSPITEDFESGSVTHPRYWSIPADHMTADGTNRVYRLRDEHSQLFGLEDWSNYKVSGKLKIKDSRINPDLYNTAFEIVMRKKAAEGEYTAQGGTPFVYRMADEDAGNYMRIGTSPGPTIDIEDEQWHTFAAEVSGQQLIFTIDNTTQYYAWDGYTHGGFSFAAINSEVYLDDLIVSPAAGGPTLPVSSLIGLTSPRTSVAASVYDIVSLSGLTAVQAHYPGGGASFVTLQDGLQWELVDGADDAELLEQDTLRFKPTANESSTVTVRARYGDEHVDIAIEPFVPAQGEYAYVLEGTEKRQENLLYMLRKRYEEGGIVLGPSVGASYLPNVFGKMMLHPKAKNYDEELAWMRQYSYDNEHRNALRKGIGDNDFSNIQTIILYKELYGAANLSSAAWNDMLELVQTSYYAEPHLRLSENHMLVHYALGYLVAEIWPDAPMWNGLTGAANKATYKTYIKDWINKRLKLGMGEYDSHSYYGIDIGALSTLFTYASDTDVKAMASTMLNYLYADMAADSLDGSLTGAGLRSYPDPVTHLYGHTHYGADMLFDNAIVKMNENYPVANAQAAMIPLSDFRPSEVVLRIMRDQTKRFNNKERRQVYSLPDDRNITASLKKYTHITPEYGLGSVVQQDVLPLWVDTGTPSEDVNGTWVPQTHQEIPFKLTFGKQSGLHIFESHPGPKGETMLSDSQGYWMGNLYDKVNYKYMQEDNVVIGMRKISKPGVPQWTHFWMEKNKFDQVDEEDGWIFIHHGNVYAAIRPMKDGQVTASPQYTWTLSGKWKDKEIKVLSPNTAFVCEVVDQAEYSGTFAQFKADIKDNPISYNAGSSYSIAYTGLNGKQLTLDFNTDVRTIDQTAVDFDAYKLQDSPYVTADWNAPLASIRLQYGDLTDTLEEIADFND